MVRKTGRLAVPTIVIDGVITVGFNEETIEKQLGA